MTGYIVKFTDPWHKVNYINSGRKSVQNPMNAKIYETYEAAEEIADICKRIAAGEINQWETSVFKLLKCQKPGMKPYHLPGWAADAKVCKVTFEVEEM